MKRKLPAALLIAGLVATAPLADVELVLQNGDTVRGTEVRRDGDNYVLTTADGGAVTLPLQTVEQVRLVGNDSAIEGRNLNPEQKQPRTGLQVEAPQQLAGQPVAPPQTSQQLAVFGKPAHFQQGPEPDPMPPSYWDTSKDALADSRSTWIKPPNDPQWKPTSALGPDQLAAHESQWQQSPTDSTWVPQDGFKQQQKEQSSSLWVQATAT